MKHVLEVCLVALTLTAGVTASGATQAAASDNASFAGTWEERLNNLPRIKLNIQEAEGKISGDIVLYFQKRDHPAGPWHVAGESTAPLRAPHVEGKTLTFEVQHHRCHGCPELGPNVKFRMALIGTNEAQLWKLNEGSDSDHGLTLVRQIEASGGSAPAMQKGISVELPVTTNAVSVPKADKEDSLIVTVTYDGSVYFGVKPISTAELLEKVKGVLSNRKEKTLYIKADARTPYANVLKVLDAVRTAGVEAPNLLTVQRDSSEPAILVPPKGLEVSVGPPFPSGPEATVVQMLNSGQRMPRLRINGEHIVWANLPDTLRQQLQNPNEKVVLVKADRILPFADVVKMTDMCRSMGAKVVLVTPKL